MAKEKYTAPIVENVELKIRDLLTSSPFTGDIEQPESTNDKSWFEGIKVEGIEEW